MSKHYLWSCHFKTSMEKKNHPKNILIELSVAQLGDGCTPTFIVLFNMQLYCVLVEHPLKKGLNYFNVNGKLSSLFNASPHFAFPRSWAHVPCRPHRERAWRKQTRRP